MKICFYRDPAYQYSLMSEELRKRGFNATILNLRKWVSKHDLYIRLKIFKLTHRFDIGHTWGFNADKIPAKKIIHHFHGSDLRDVIGIKNGNPIIKYRTPKYPCFVSSRDLLEVAPHAIHLPRCVNVDIFKEDEVIREKKNLYKDKKGIDFIIGHSPTQIGKGSFKVYSAIKILKEEGYSLELKTLKKFIIPHDSMWIFYNIIDVFLDQFIVGSFGTSTLEALLCGTPSVCYIKKDCEDKDLEKYILNAYKPHEIAEMIKKSKGIKPNPNDVIKSHSPSHTVDIMLKYYEKWGLL